MAVYNNVMDTSPYRERTKEIPVTELSKYITDTTKIFFRKDDGVQVQYNINDNKVNVITPKPSVSGKLIQRNQQLTIPSSASKSLNGTKAYGEVMLIDSNGRALPLQNVVGYLNMSADKGREYIKNNNLSVYHTLFDIDSIGGNNMEKEPFKYKLQAIKTLAPILNAAVPEYAITPEQKIKLLSDISSGANIKSKEGVIIQDLENNASKVLKSKFKKEYDVFVTGIVNSKNTIDGVASGFEYSHTPDGGVVGKVGTGFSFKERIDMALHPEKYIGRVAKVKAIRKNESGALFQPSFQSWHTEKGKSVWL